MTDDAGLVSADPAAPASDVAPNLGRRAARGGFAVLLGQGARIVIQIVSVAVLARLLSPNDYGLVAIVLAIVGVGEIFRDFGLSTAAVQAAVVTDRQRDKLFWVNTAIGAVLTVATFAAAPLIAELFNHSALTPITQGLAFTFLLNGMTAQYEADLNRSLRFAAMVTVSVGSQALGTVAAIVLAASGAGYWSLVVQQLVAAMITLAAFAVLTRWIPRWPRRDADIRSFVRFGIGLVATQIIGYLDTNVDTMTIAVRMSPVQLGYYNRGYQLLMRTLGQLRAPTTSVALPVLRVIRDDEARLADFLLRGQRALGYSLVAGVAIAAGAAEPMVQVFLGHRWASVAPVFAWLAVAGVFQTVSYIAYWMYLARGLTAQLAGVSVISLSLKIVCVLVGSQWGITGVAAGFAIAPALAAPISMWRLARLTSFPARRLYAGASWILLAAAVAGTAAFGTTRLMSAAPPVLELAVSVLAGAASYGVLAAVLPPVRADLRDVLRIVRGAVRRRAS